MIRDSVEKYQITGGSNTNLLNAHNLPAATRNHQPLVVSGSSRQIMGIQ
jgi:hypothetical protein